MGVYTRAQLAAAGVARSGLTRRVRAGTLVRLLPGVYSDPEPSMIDRWVALTLWREDAVLSHATAAYLWDLLPDAPPTVDATVPRAARPEAPEWLTLHRRTVVAAERHGFPVVPVAQCFIDVAATLQGVPLEQFFDRNIGMRVSWRAVADHCDEAKGMAGISEVRRQLLLCCPGTLSEPERLVARAVRKRGVRMDINAPIGPYVGDLVEYTAKVDIEVDGRSYHIAPIPFDNDRTRQNWMVLRGWLVLRYSAATVYRDVDKVADEIVAVVRRRRRNRGA
ncbi:type IV toxin-antitoxin system AbiEi family antitoxin domain-containing protein [Rhodococcus sp. P1Y]|uniref:type IV toxin-antitoxin system AbiEi family antitoxin domain-containing protein n=1 Tax=Rhodococcus sp. P1Y TaxID=1302308 RepID=UPI000EADB62A|nr:type IV toxin-antitoxin system AbiEi family antitoxin domain-containing protein [Rhodococcus sp. P1Y]AYJ48454.1 DUF559 domain-containing protein [Rhodococcus sp. P1Y]